MSWCVLDEEKFHQCCWLFLQQSEQLRDGWSWEAVQGSKEGYLRKTALRSVPTDWITTQKHEGSVLECHCSLKSQGEDKLVASVDPDFLRGDIEDEDDGICTVCEGNSLVLQYEYHILYSCSYSAPVLYFRAFTLGGKSLTLEEVWSSVHPHFRLHLQNCPLNAITQQNRGVYEAHAAGGSGTVPVNYVLSWLSVVGPVLGLDVPLKYSTQLLPEASPSTMEPN
ncbi:ubiquitin-like-conjugating enzyme ATG10 isoform X3 [Leuresthes tenuis]|uniref:ubiquitin-like-conjugating enzyme ATG10 isoform X3 n=1 Tax=Leuresthes tenuis TaxID=355514 RepID=UPI003B50490B